MTFEFLRKVIPETDLNICSIDLPFRLELIKFDLCHCPSPRFQKDVSKQGIKLKINKLSLEIHLSTTFLLQVTT